MFSDSINALRDGVTMKFNAKREYDGMPREKRIELNYNILDNSGIDFIVTPRKFYIPKSDKYPRCIFYPSTGRWIITRCGTAKKGGADEFIKWLTIYGG